METINFWGVYLGEGRLDDHAAKCIRYLEATKGCREVQEFSDEVREFKRFWVFWKAQEMKPESCSKFCASL